MACVRTPFSPSLLALLVVGALVVAACGDGIDERTEPLVPEQAATTTEPEPEPDPIELPTFELEQPAVVVDGTHADYSGARSALHLADGTWLVTGYDNHSTFSQPEPGAVWRGDGTEFDRVGDDISEEKGQQVITSLLELASGRIVAVGSNFSRDDPEADFYLYDASVWLSDDQGTSFRQVSLREDAGVTGALLVDNSIFVYGYQFVVGEDSVASGQIWRSDDEGESWQELDPSFTSTPGAAPSPLGTIARLLVWDGSLVAVGHTTATDPAGSDYALDRFSLSSPTEQWEPVDIALWYSDDLGATWHSSIAQGLSGLPDAQVAASAVVVGDQLVIVGAASDVSPDFNFDPGEFEFDPETFDPETFDPETFDPETFDPDEWADLDAPQMLATIWTCDYLLQRCDTITLHDESSDYIAAMVVERDGMALAAFSGFTGQLSEGEHLVAVDPHTGEFEVLALPERFEQTSAIVIDGERLVMFGRDGRLDQLSILVATIVG